ncbi:hypothetical protein [Bradyrhizobium diazoefficiens]|nr:hypothetical protein XF16B_45160 [Bradyrhizobium diazoefficiens]BCF70169.1 hypothetical protein XF19B_45220 [Bradyrhizobium diazoefficiens]
MQYYWPRIGDWEGCFVTYIVKLEACPSHSDWIVPGTYYDPEFA